jgi:hypothetical protein
MQKHSTSQMLLTVISAKNLCPGDARSTTFTCSVRTATWRDNFPRDIAIFTRQLTTADHPSHSVLPPTECARGRIQ